MAHAAGLYTVRVKERYATHKALGNIDDAGTYLRDVLAGYFNGLQATDPDSGRIATCVSSRTSGDELIATVQHGHSGVASRIFNARQQERLRKVQTDIEYVNCGVLFKLPPTQTLGWLALHVNAGHGIKGLLDRSLPPRFAGDFPELMLQIKAYVPGTALQQAIDDDAIAEVKLLRYETPSDRATASVNRWIGPQESGKITVSIRGKGRSQRLRTRLLERFIREPADEHEIFEFEGIPFEQVKVVADVGGRQRTFNLQNPATGHPMTVDISPVLDADGEPDPASVIQELRGALNGVAQ